MEDLGFCAGLDYLQLLPSLNDKSMLYGSFLGAPLNTDTCSGEGDLVDPPNENFPDPMADDDESDDDIDMEELERRMWRDRMRFKRLKEQMHNQSKEQSDPAKQRQSQEQARRKKMSRAQDGILKYMLKMMEVCKAQGFVYGIIPEKGKPVSGASDNLRADLAPPVHGLLHCQPMAQTRGLSDLRGDGSRNRLLRLLARSPHVH